MAQKTKIIFDNDGVNIDSEHLAMRVMDDFGYELVTKYLGEPVEGLNRGDIYTKYKGVSSNAIIADLVKEFDLPIEAIIEDYTIQDQENVIEELSDQLTMATIAEFEKGLYTLPDFVSTITAINEKFGKGNVALCTTSRADRMDATVHAKAPETDENAGWGEFFPDENNLRISGYGHPNKYEYFRDLHPDWDPAEVIVVEDTDGSTKKAIAAGFTDVIGIVASRFQCDTPENKQAEIKKLIDAGACVVVTNYRDLPNAVKWIENDMNPNDKPDFNASVYPGRSSQFGNQQDHVFSPA